MRYVIAVVLAFLTASFGQHAPGTAAGIATPRGSGSSPTSLTFGDAHFNVPMGWRHVEKQSGATTFMLVIPPDITKTEKFSILLLPGQDLQGADFPQTFDRILKQGLAADEHLIKYSEAPVRKIAGYENIPSYDLLTRSMVLADDAGRRSFRICFAANPRHRLEMLIMSADSQEMFKRYEADVAVLLNSWSFGGASVPAADTKKEESGAAHAPASPERGRTATTSKFPPGTRSQVPAGVSVLLCTDPARLDGAMDFAKYGNAYNALQAMRHVSFFRVTGPTWVEVRESDVKSRWPKVLVTVLDGVFVGRTGWVVLSELKDLKEPARE